MKTGKHRFIGGFTLLELMLAITVAAVLFSLAAPNFRTFILNNRLTSTSNDLLHSVQSARSEAAKRQENVVLCGSSDPAADSPACATSSFAGWIIFQDNDADGIRDAADEVIETHAFDSETVNLAADNDWHLSFSPAAFLKDGGTTSIVISDHRGNVEEGGQSTARGISITATGRPSITRSRSKIVDLLALIDASTSTT
jgi:type IV fimbrial biogenesis protein FimT